MPALLAAFAALAAGTAARVAGSDLPVDVVVDMTPEGRKVAPPAPHKPVFYLPVLGGYMERGAVYAGEPAPPPPLEVAHLVAVTLAEQGYLVTNANSPPSIVLSVFWGSLNPVTMKLGGGSGPGMILNETEMLALVGGNTLKNLDLHYERENVMQGAERDRFFVVLSAYDYNAYAKSKKVAAAAVQARTRTPQPKRVLLWQAKMSAPSNRVELAEVLPALVKAGGPQFGRETIRPKTVFTPLPEGRVEIGTPEVTGDAPPSAEAGPQPKDR
jgi:hypothetical protein